MATAAEARQQAELARTSVPAYLDVIDTHLEHLQRQLSELEEKLAPVLLPAEELRGLVSTEVTKTSTLGSRVRVLADRLDDLVTGVRELTARVDL